MSKHFNFSIITITFLLLGAGALVVSFAAVHAVDVRRRQALERDFVGECRAAPPPSASALRPCVARWALVSQKDRELVQGQSTDIAVEFENSNAPKPCQATATLRASSFDVSPSSTDLSREITDPLGRLSWNVTPKTVGAQAISINTLLEERGFGFYVRTSKTIPDEITGIGGIVSLVVGLVRGFRKPDDAPRVGEPAKDGDAKRDEHPGAPRAFMTFAGRDVPDDFIERTKDLRVMFKDGYSFFDERPDAFVRRFRNQNLHTTVLIVHPESPVLGAVASMDPKKDGPRQNDDPNRKEDGPTQKGDCLSAVRAMKRIRDELKGENIDIARRVDFYGYDSVPTWTGFLSDTKAYLSLYPSSPHRGELLTLEVGAGDDSAWAVFFERYSSDFQDVLRHASHRRSLFDYAAENESAVLRGGA